jgi:uncharacterized repeat protein (TIGR02543 family)
MKRLSIRSIIIVIFFVCIAAFITACKPEEETPPVPNKITIIFDVNAGTDTVTNEPDVTRINSGEKVTMPNPNPGRNGYDFVGWFDNSEGSGDPFNFDTTITQNNFTLYAKWAITIQYHSVTFDYSGGGANHDEEVADMDTVDEPEEPNRDGYRFVGWFIDDEFSSQYNFSNEVTSDFTLYAKWIQRVSITFNLNYEGAATPAIQELDINQTADEPNTPVRTDYTFAGWFIDQQTTTPYEFDAITENITVYAKWIENASTVTHTVEFVYGYDGSPDNVVQTIVSGGVITQISTTRENHRFLGWYLDQDTFLNRFTSSTPVTQDLVLYGNWIRTYQLIVDYNYAGAINPQPMTVDQDASISSPQVPSRIGYTFAGWSDQSKGLIGYDLSDGIQEDTTIYAQWSKVNIFEAEYLDFSDFFGWGFSGNATGTDAILEDIGGEGEASNGRFVTYLYGEGITLTYNITSDRAVENATLTLRLSGEVKDFYIQALKTPEVIEEEPVYTVKVNGQTIDYGVIGFTDVPSQSENKLLPFQDFIMSINVSLVEGENEILLITDNALLMGGTMGATAPMVDCIKITTYAILTWEPILDNY